MNLTNKELALVVGGSLTSSFLNSITNMAKTIYNLGYSIGSTIRRLIKGKLCRI